MTPNSPVRNGPGTVGFPVVIGGVHVESGDILIGDADGVVVVPRLEAEAVLARLPAIKAAEQAAGGESARRSQLPDFARTVLQSDKTSYVD